MYIHICVYIYTCYLLPIAYCLLTVEYLVASPTAVYTYVYMTLCTYACMCINICVYYYTCIFDEICA